MEEIVYSYYNNGTLATVCQEYKFWEIKWLYEHYKSNSELDILSFIFLQL